MLIVVVEITLLSEASGFKTALNWVPHFYKCSKSQYNFIN